MIEQKTYIAIDLKSFYASVECMERNRNPLTTNLVVADASRTNKTICLADSPSLKTYGIPGRPRLFEVVQKIKEVNAFRQYRAPKRVLEGASDDYEELQKNSSLAVDYIVAQPRMALYIEYSTRIYNVYLKYIAPEDIHTYSIDEVFIDEAPDEEKNFTTLLEMINASEAREDDESFKNAVDLMFEELEQENPEHFAVRQYKKYKLAAGKTAKSILISCGARLAPFDIKELRDLMSYDELELDLMGDRKTAMFVIISDTDDTFNFVVSIMYTQLFNLLCDRADDKYNGRLPIHVRCLLDEFANIGQIPKFEKLIATIRSREISASIILQSQSQLKAIYKDSADTIVGNCDTTLFLGGKETTTLKEMSEMLGKETIDMFNTTDTRGSSRSYGINYQKTGKELMSRDELAVMDGGKCILQLRGVRPFFSDKFDITKHKRYCELSDSDERLLLVFSAGTVVVIISKRKKK